MANPPHAALRGARRRLRTERYPARLASTASLPLQHTPGSRRCCRRDRGLARCNRIADREFEDRHRELVTRGMRILLCSVRAHANFRYINSSDGLHGDSRSGASMNARRRGWPQGRCRCAAAREERGTDVDKTDSFTPNAPNTCSFPSPGRKVRSSLLSAATSSRSSDAAFGRQSLLVPAIAISSGV